VKEDASRAKDARLRELRPTWYPMALEEGYYAGHFYAAMRFDVRGHYGTIERRTSALKVQVTTRIQHEVRSLLHIWYEDRRRRPGSWLQRTIVNFNGSYYHSFCLDEYELVSSSKATARSVPEGDECPHCHGVINRGERWQWKLNAGEFNAYNLGHVLHYIEGKIVAARHELPWGTDGPNAAL
jgi:hypothetical protein